MATILSSSPPSRRNKRNSRGAGHVPSTATSDTYATGNNGPARPEELGDWALADAFEWDQTDITLSTDAGLRWLQGIGIIPRSCQLEDLSQAQREAVEILLAKLQMHNMDIQNLQVNDLKDSPLAQDLERVLGLLPPGTLGRADSVSRRNTGASERSSGPTISVTAASAAPLTSPRSPLANSQDTASRSRETNATPMYKGGSVVLESTGDIYVEGDEHGSPSSAGDVPNGRKTDQGSRSGQQPTTSSQDNQVPARTGPRVRVEELVDATRRLAVAWEHGRSILQENRQLELETSALLIMSRARLQAEIISLRREAAALRATVEPSATLNALAAEKRLTSELQRLLDERDHQVMALSQSLRQRNEEVAVLRGNLAVMKQGAAHRTELNGSESPKSHGSPRVARTAADVLQSPSLRSSKAGPDNLLERRAHIDELLDRHGVPRAGRNNIWQAASSSTGPETATTSVTNAYRPTQAASLRQPTTYPAGRGLNGSGTAAPSSFAGVASDAGGRKASPSQPLSPSSPAVPFTI